MRKKHVALITIMTALSITACGGAKEADTTTEVQQPQAAVETVADVAETEKADAVIETAETVETTEAEPTETETEVTVSADSKLDVKIIGTCPGLSNDGDVLVFSFTNISDEAIVLNGERHISIGDIDYADDLFFRPGETDYGLKFSANGQLESITEDELRAGLDGICSDMPEGMNTDMVLYTTEFTSDNFGDAASLIRENLNKIGESRLVMCYKNDELVGVVNSLSLEGDSIENPYDADRIVIFWYQVVDL